MRPSLVALSLALLVTAACAPGQTNPPESGASPPEAAAPPAAHGTAPSPPGPSDPLDASDAVQALLLHGDVVGMIHADEDPDRLPLRFADRGALRSRPPLIFEHRSVRYAEVGEEDEALVLEALTLDASGGKARLRYLPEDLEAEADLSRVAARWRVTAVRVAEVARSAPALPAGENPTDLPPAWTACSEATACVMVRNECCDAWSVGSPHREAAEREQNQRRAKRMKGARPGAPPCRRSCGSPGAPACLEGRCGFSR